MTNSEDLSPEGREKLDGFGTLTILPVQWGDQDAFGHVNNVVYFRWFETSRVDLLNACHSSVTMDGSGLGPILASMKCDYKRQLRFPDTVVVGAKVSRIGRSSADISHRIVSCAQGKIIAEGVSVIVVFDYTAQRVTRIPEDLRQQFENLISDGTIG